MRNYINHITPSRVLPPKGVVCPAVWIMRDAGFIGALEASQVNRRP